MRAVFIISIFVLLISCQSQTCRSTADLEVLPVDLMLERKGTELFQSGSVSEVAQFLKNNPKIAQNIFFIQQYPDTMKLAERIFGLIKEPSIDTLFQEATNTFEANKEKLLSGLNQAFAIFKYYYPDAPQPVLQTMVTGLYHDLYISDERLIVGIDYFIGDEATYRPHDIPEYILKRYNYDYLAPVLMKFFMNPWITNGDESTLLSEMIDFGKTYYLLSQLFPCTPDHQIIGFSAESMAEVNANQTIIWANFIQNEWLYETSDIMKKKFLGDRPNVYEIGEKCPGRIGAWVGWQIVKSYAEKTGKPITEIMAITNNHELFAQSGYKPSDISL
jgi:hypothetical protein